jgi:large subunit ribosomal protein L9
MRVLLLKDVYKLGRAGDVKRVADGYGRNYLLPQGLAVLATPGAMKQSEQIRSHANEQRAVLNKEMGFISEKITDLRVFFPAKASETGKLYGSITTQMIADAISKKSGVEINRRQIDTQPVRTLGDHKVRVRLTVDLIPTVSVVVHREGEAPAGATVEASATPEAAPVPEEKEPEIAQEAGAEA